MPVTKTRRVRKPARPAPPSPGFNVTAPATVDLPPHLKHAYEFLVAKFYTGSGPEPEPADPDEQPEWEIGEAARRLRGVIGVQERLQAVVHLQGMLTRLESSLRARERHPVLAPLAQEVRCELLDLDAQEGPLQWDPDALVLWTAPRPVILTGPIPLDYDDVDDYDFGRTRRANGQFRLNLGPLQLGLPAGHGRWAHFGLRARSTQHDDPRHPNVDARDQVCLGEHRLAAERAFRGGRLGDVMLLGLAGLRHHTPGTGFRDLATQAEMCRRQR